MLAKLLRGLAWLTGGLLLLLVLAAVALGVYLRSEQRKIVEDFGRLTGLKIDYRALTLTTWTTFPRIELTADSLSVRDLQRPPGEAPLLQADSLRGELDLDRFFDGSVRLDRLRLTDGAFFVTTDTAGYFNFGRLASPRDTTDDSGGGGFSLFKPSIAWDGARLELDNVAFDYRDSLKDKRFAFTVDTLRTTADRSPTGDLHFSSRLAADVEGLAFNNAKGPFVAGARITAPRILFSGYPDCWTIAPVDLLINGDTYSLALEYSRRGDRTLHLTIANGAAIYDRVRPLLTPDLREKLGAFSATGPVPARAELLTSPAHARDPEVIVSFALNGQAASARGFAFTDAHVRGTFHNRLPEAEGGDLSSKKNYRVILDSVRAYQGGFLVQSPGVQVRGVAEEARLTGPLRITGPAPALARRLRNRDFFFHGGRLAIDARVDGSLTDIPQLVAATDAALDLSATTVEYRPSELRLPFRRIHVDKSGEDVRFRTESDTIGTGGFHFALDGRIDNLTPLLLDRPEEHTQTTAQLTVPRMAWADFRTVLGGGAPDEGGGDAGAGAVNSAAAMKRTLRGLHASFGPTLGITIDTATYYDVLEVTRFRSRLTFDHDSLVLDSTHFDWAGSDLAFGARLALEQEARTPFALTARAAGVDLNALRPTLEFFGLALPDGLDELPRDFHLDFDHTGIINDTFGIQPGSNRGRLRFHDGVADRFAGTFNYHPGPRGLSSHLELGGRPTVVNRLFAAERFLFGGGRFRLDLATEGNPADLAAVVRNARLNLTIDSSRVTYAPTGLSLPVVHFGVEAVADHAGFRLHLLQDSTDHNLTVSGQLDRLTGFLLPDAGAETFRLRADARARRLHWRDLRDLTSPTPPLDPLPEPGERRVPVAPVASGPTVDPAPAAPPPADTSDATALLSTTGGIFATLRPDLSLRVDTFLTGDGTLLTGLHGGLRMEDSTRLILEQSGFVLNGSPLELSGSYALDSTAHSPFTAEWRTDSLSLADLSYLLGRLGLEPPARPGTLTGHLSSRGRLAGTADENRRRPLSDRSSLAADFDLRDLILADWPALTAFGDKIFMKKRFRRVAAAPLTGRLTVDSNRYVLPQTEVQTTAIQLFVEGTVDPATGPDLLVSVPVWPNLFRGVLDEAPARTGYDGAGWKVFFVVKRDEKGRLRQKFRLGRRRYDRRRLRASRSPD